MRMSAPKLYQTEQRKFFLERREGWNDKFFISSLSNLTGAHTYYKVIYIFISELFRQTRKIDHV
jgi:hypothetical protein